MTNVFNENMAQPPQSSQPNCQYTTRYCWEADKVKTLIRLRAELSPLFTGKRNASKYAWAVVERELNVPLPLSKIIKKWNNLLQEYKAIKLSEEPKRREWPFFTLMDVYFSDQVNDPTLRLFSSTKTLKETIDDSVFEDDPIISSAIAAATSGALMDISELVRRQKLKQENDTDSNYGDVTPETSLNDYNNTNDDKKSLASTVLQQQQQQLHQPPQVPRRKEREAKAQQEYRQQQQQQQQSQQHQQQQQQQQQHQQQQIQREQQSIHQQQQQLQQQQQQQQQQRQQLPQQSQTPEHHTIDQYLLSWNNFHGNMCRGFHSLQKDEKMVDVTIAAGGKIFKAHKLVLSVCSPYFQKIFLDHPCSHPILFMTDVDSNHMAGLLDFMYSGQVNVKYEDLPNFLKTAEAMRIKGLHSESTIESEADFRAPKLSEDNQGNRYGSNQSLNTPPVHSSIYSNTNGPTTPTSVNNPNTSPARSCQPPIPSPNFLSFRDHIRSKAAINEAFMNNAAANNNNVSHEKYSIQQTNSSNKILDGRKHHKYFAKRKMLMQYNQDIMREKRNRELGEVEQSQQQQQQQTQPQPQQQSSQVQQEQHSPINDNFRIKLPDIRGNSGGDVGGGSSSSGGSGASGASGETDVREEALNLVQTIKKEPCDAELPHSRCDRREEDCSSTTPTDSTVDEEAENEAKAALLKLRHSILEQNLINSNVGGNNNNNNNKSTNNNNNNNYSKNNNNNNKPPPGDCGNVSLDRNMNAVCS